MTLLPLDIPPGIVKVDSPNAAKGRYTDSDKIRFIRGRPEKWRGWVKIVADQMLGKARGAVSWTNRFGNTNAAFGTNRRLYAFIGGDTLENITPMRATGVSLGADPFEVEEDSTIVRVTHVEHGADAGAFVTFSGAVSVGGITVNGEYEIIEVIDANTYTIEHSTPANANATGGGNSVRADYELNPGQPDTVSGHGWGAGPWGEGTWGTERDTGIDIYFRYWSLQEYGNELMASPSGGSLYLWEQQTDDRAEHVTNAPASARAMFVTGERFVFMLGTTSPMTVQWPDQDDPTDWTPTAANTANVRTLQVGSRLMNGVALVDGVSLVWTDIGVYVFQYTGTDLVYDSRLAGTSCGLIGQHAFTKASGVAFWMSPQGFHMYVGGVQVIPNAEDVRAWVFRDIDPEQVLKTWCIYDQRNHQVRWHYCSRGATEPNRYVDVSLHDFSWTIGTLDRITGTLYRPSTGSSLLVSHDGYIYEHDIGTDADGQPLRATLTFGLYALTRGERNVDIMGLIPDCERQSGYLKYTIFTKDWPNSPGILDVQSVTLAPGDPEANLRVCGRFFSMEIESNQIGGDFRLGIPHLEVAPAGMRL